MRGIILQIVYLIGVVVFTIILNSFIERYILKNTDDLIIYIKESYKNKSLILISIIELILALVLGINMFFAYYYFVVYILYKICEVDLKTKLIDGRLFIILIVLAVASVLVDNNGIISDKVIAFAITLILFVILSKVTKNGFGMGDAKVIAVLGFIFGVQGVMAILIIASALVFLVSIFMIIKSFSNKKKDIPFTPFLFLAVIVLLIVNNI